MIIEKYFIDVDSIFSLDKVDICILVINCFLEYLFDEFGVMLLLCKN